MMKQYALYIGGILLVVGAILPLFLPNIEIGRAHV